MEFSVYTVGRKASFGEIITSPSISPMLCKNMFIRQRRRVLARKESRHACERRFIYGVVHGFRDHFSGRIRKSTRSNRVVGGTTINGACQNVPRHCRDTMMKLMLKTLNQPPHAVFISRGTEYKIVWPDQECI